MLIQHTVINIFWGHQYIYSFFWYLPRQLFLCLLCRHKNLPVMSAFLHKAEDSTKRDSILRPDEHNRTTCSQQLTTPADLNLEHRHALHEHPYAPELFQLSEEYPDFDQTLILDLLQEQAGEYLAVWHELKVGGLHLPKAAIHIIMQVYPHVEILSGSVTARKMLHLHQCFDHCMLGCILCWLSSFP